MIYIMSTPDKSHVFDSPLYYKFVVFSEDKAQRRGATQTIRESLEHNSGV